MAGIGDCKGDWNAAVEEIIGSGSERRRARFCLRWRGIMGTTGFAVGSSQTIQIAATLYG